MMDNFVTKKDLEEFRIILIKDIERLLKIDRKDDDVQDFEWLRSKTVRQMMNISAGTLQNLRIQRKIRFRKVLGSYYYHKQDLLKLFKKEG